MVMRRGKGKMDATAKAKTPAVKTMPTYDALVSAIESLVLDARAGLKAAMNAIMLQTYWRTGEYIVEYEQNGSDRAIYGSGLMRRLARDLALKLGRGFSHANLIYMRKLYVVSQKSQTSDFFRNGQTSGFLTWSHYMEILRADDLVVQYAHAGDFKSPLREQIPVVFAQRGSVARQVGGIARQCRERSENQVPHGQQNQRHGVKGAICKNYTRSAIN